MNATHRLFPCLAALALLLLLATGCASLPRMLGGSADVRLTLDGEQNHAASVPRGQVLFLELRDPASSGYAFAGAAFNTDLLRLEGIEQPEAGGRVRYVFTALGPGESEVLIKIRQPGHRPEVYKRVRVVVE